MDNKITIIDYGLGNLGSIKNMLKKIGVASEITNDLSKIKLANKLILPGVGSFDDGMNNLIKLNLQNILNDKVLIDKVPILGICLGMQLMLNSSDEGFSTGLNWVNGKSIKFADLYKGHKLIVPHMGWNNVSVLKKNKLFSQDILDYRFYFVHSYYVQLDSRNDIIGQTTYGLDFTSSFNCDNIYGVQFHPEKSHKFGMNLLKNFSTL